MNLNQVTIPVTKIKRSIYFYTSTRLKLIVHTHNKYAIFVCPIGNSNMLLHVVKSINPDAQKTIYFERNDLDEYLEILQKKE